MPWENGVWRPYRQDELKQGRPDLYAPSAQELVGYLNNMTTPKLPQMKEPGITDAMMQSAATPPPSAPFMPQMPKTPQMQWGLPTQTLPQQPKPPLLGGNNAKLEPYVDHRNFFQKSTDFAKSALTGDIRDQIGAALTETGQGAIDSVPFAEQLTNRMIGDQTGQTSKRIHEENAQLIGETAAKAFHAAGMIGGTVMGGEVLAPVKGLQGLNLFNTAKTGQGMLRAALPALEQTAAGKALNAAANAAIYGMGNEVVRGYTDPNAERNTLTEFGAGTRQGLADVGSGFGKAMTWASNPDQGILGKSARALGLDNLGKHLDEASKVYGKGFQHDFGAFGWKALLNPNYYAYNVSRMLPFTAATIPASVAGAEGMGLALGAAGIAASRPFLSFMLKSAAAGAASAPLEAAVEAGQIYEDVYKKTGDVHLANKASSKGFWLNTGVLAAFNAGEFATIFMPKGISKFMDSPGGRIGFGMTNEGAQESAQQIIQNYAENKPLMDPSVIEQGALGAIFGGFMGGAGHVASAESDHSQTLASIQDKVLTKLDPQDQQDLQERIKEGEAQGVPADQIKQEALDALAQHPDGQQMIDEAVQEEMKSQATKQLASMTPEQLMQHAAYQEQQRVRSHEALTGLTGAERVARAQVDPTGVMQGYNVTGPAPQPAVQTNPISTPSQRPQGPKEVFRQGDYVRLQGTSSGLYQVADDRAGKKQTVISQDGTVRHVPPQALQRHNGQLRKGDSVSAAGRDGMFTVQDVRDGKRIRVVDANGTTLHFNAGELSPAFSNPVQQQQMQPTSMPEPLTQTPEPAAPVTQPADVNVNVPADVNVNVPGAAAQQTPATPVNEQHVQQAKDIIQQTRSASISTLQRHMKIDYTSAAKLIDQLEAEGFIGPYEGSNGGRKIFGEQAQSVTEQAAAPAAPVTQPEDVNVNVPADVNVNVPGAVQQPQQDAAPTVTDNAPADSVQPEQKKSEVPEGFFKPLIDGTPAEKEQRDAADLERAKNTTREDALRFIADHYTRGALVTGAIRKGDAEGQKAFRAAAGSSVKHSWINFSAHAKPEILLLDGRKFETTWPELYKYAREIAHNAAADSVQPEQKKSEVPQEYTLKEFMADNRWEAYPVPERPDSPKEVKGQNYMRMPNGNNWQSGYIGKGKPEKVKREFHREQVRRAVFGGHEVDDRVLADYPDLQQAMETIRDIVGRMTVHKSGYVSMAVNGDTKWFHVKDAPTYARYSMREFVAENNLIDASTKSVDKVYFNDSEMTVIAVERKVTPIVGKQWPSYNGEIMTHSGFYKGIQSITIRKPTAFNDEGEPTAFKEMTGTPKKKFAYSSLETLHYTENGEETDTPIYPSEIVSIEREKVLTPDQVVRPLPDDAAQVDDAHFKAYVTAIRKLIDGFAAGIEDGTLPTGKAAQGAIRKLAAQIMGRPVAEDEWNDALEAAVQYVAQKRMKGTADMAQRIEIGKEMEGYMKVAGRSLEKMDRQQFSTPVPLAEVVRYAADYQGGTIKEGSAGTGSLILPFVESGDAKARDITPIELSPRRAAILTALGFGNVINDNTFNAMDVKADTVVGNPPFRGENNARGKTAAFKGNPPWKGGWGDLGNRFLAWDLNSLPKGGRLVYIVSPSVITGRQNAPFRKWLEENHTVRAMITFPESVYDSRGTSFGAGLIVVDKGKSDGAAEPIQGTPESVEQLIDWLKPLREGGTHARVVQPTAGQQSTPGNQTGAAGNGVQPGQRGQSTGNAGTSGVRGAGVGNSGAEAGISGGTDGGRGSIAPDNGGVAGSNADVLSGNGNADVVDQGSQSAADNVSGQSETAGRTDDAGVSADAAGRPGGSVSDNVSQSVEPVSRNDDQPVEPKVGFEQYVPQEIAGRGHLGNVVEPTNLQFVEMPQEMFKDPMFRPEPIVVNGGANAEYKLSDIQLEAVMAAKYNWFRDKRGVLIADDTGLGKTAEQLGIIADAWHSGRAKRILVVTKSDQIATDSFIEENKKFDLGTPFTFVNSDTHKNFKDDVYYEQFGPSESVLSDMSRKKAQSIRKKYSDQTTLVRMGKREQRDWKPLDVGNGAMVMSFDTFRNAGYAVNKWLDDANGDVLVIYDESHTLKNVEGAEVAIAAAKLYERLEKKGNAQHIYASATAAEDLSGMEHLFGLKLWNTKTFGEFRHRLKGNQPNTYQGGNKSQKNKLAKALAKSQAESGSAFTREIPLVMMEQIVRELKMEGQYLGRALSMEGIDMVPVPIALSPKDVGDWNRAASFLRLIASKAEEHGQKPTDRGKIMSQVVGYMRRLRSYYVAKGIIDHMKKQMADGTFERFAISGIFVSESENANVSAAINAINEMERIENDDGTLDFEVIPEAIYDKQQLYAIMRGENPEWGEKVLPDLPSPVKMFYEAFGEEKVLVINKDVKKEERPNITKMFRNGERPIVFFTKAGNTGVSMHDMVGKPIAFYHLDYPWEAKDAKQSEGRVNRTGQKSLPTYYYPYTDSSIDMKFVGTLMARYEAMGALSRGKSAKLGGEALADFDLSGQIAIDAIYLYIPNMDADDRAQMFGEFTRELFPQGEVIDPIFAPSRVRELFSQNAVDTKKFLNALMFLNFNDGNRVFNEYVAEINRLKELAAAQGGVSTEFETYHGKEISVAEGSSGIKLRQIQTLPTDEQKKHFARVIKQAESDVVEAEAKVTEVTENVKAELQDRIAKGQEKVTELETKLREQLAGTEEIDRNLRDMVNSRLDLGSEISRVQNERISAADEKEQEKQQEKREKELEKLRAQQEKIAKDIDKLRAQQDKDLKSREKTREELVPAKRKVAEAQQQLQGIEQNQKDVIDQVPKIRSANVVLDMYQRRLTNAKAAQELQGKVLLIDGKILTNGLMVAIRSAIQTGAVAVYGENPPDNAIAVDMRGYYLQNGERVVGAVVPRWAEPGIIQAFNAGPSVTVNGDDIAQLKQTIQGGVPVMLDNGYELRWMPTKKQIIVGNMRAGTDASDRQVFEQLKGSGDLVFDAVSRAVVVGTDEGLRKLVKRFPIASGDNNPPSGGKSLQELERQGGQTTDALKGNNIGIVPPGVRRKVNAGAYTFEDAEIEQRFSNANGLPKETLLHKAHKKMVQLKNQFSRVFEHLPNTALYAPLKNALISLQKQKGVAHDRVFRNILQRIVTKLSRADYNLFRRKVILDDMYQEMLAGREIAFGFTPEVLEQELVRINDAIAGNDFIADALKQRKQFWAAIKTGYIESMEQIGFNVRDRLTKDDYYRHMVMEYAKDRIEGVSGKSSVKTPTNSGFLRKRKGSEMDYNTDYLQAESEVMVKMLYDIELAKVIQLVDQKHNIMESLKESAKEANMDALQVIYDREIDSRNYLDKDDEPVSPTEKTYKSFNQQMAAALSSLGKMADQLWIGDDGEFERLVASLEKKKANHPDVQDANDQFSTVDGGKLFRYLSMLAKRGEAGSMQAAWFLKAVSDRRMFVKQTLADDYKTWREMVPKTGYAIWQPRKGSVLYLASTIDTGMLDDLGEMLAQRVVEGFMTQDQADMAVSMLQEAMNPVMAKGGRYREFVIPIEVAETLDNIMEPPTQSAVSNAIDAATTLSKKSLLLTPTRAIKYNLRNLSSDLDKMIANNPGAIRMLPKAAKELWTVMTKGGSMTPTLQDWFNRGGMETVLNAQEMGEINRMQIFMRLHDDKRNVLQKASDATIMRVFRGVRLGTDLREATFRYAMYLDYAQQIDKKGGKPGNFGSSKREHVMSLDDPKDRAFKLSNEALVDYSSTTVAGRWIRKKLIPFWSWTEGNMKSTIQMFRNAIDDEKFVEALGRKMLGKAVARSPYIAYRTGALALKVGFVAAILQLFNQLKFPDEEKELPQDVRDTIHIVLGRDENGKVIYFNRLGYLQDFLEWFGADSMYRDMQDIFNNKRTLGEVAWDKVKQIGSKAINMVNPIAKGTGEAIAGVNLYPNAFAPSKEYDRVNRLFSAFGLDKEYNLVKDALSGHETPGPKYDPVTHLLAYKSDSEQTNYYAVKDLVRKFMKEKGISPGSAGEPGDKSEALYNYKMAIRYGDKEAKDYFLKRYIAKGGTAQGLRSSLFSMDPLDGLGSALNKGMFLASLDDEEKAKYQQAQQFYARTLISGQKPLK